MAQLVTEKVVVRGGGTMPDLITLFGSCAPAAGGTAIVIQPGESDTNIAGSRGLRKIVGYAFTNKTAQKAALVVKSYDSTHDGDILTLTVAADDNYDFVIWGEDNGA